MNEELRKTGMEVRKVTSDEDRQSAFQVRHVVFVREQNVDPEEEYDEFDLTAAHFIAYDASGEPCGTARWRTTQRGVKLERFAVLKSHRNQGVGAALLRAVIADVENELPRPLPLVYLHAQTTAIPFYQRYGFQKEGDEFEECLIKHFKMVRK